MSAPRQDRPARWERCLARAGAQLLPLTGEPGRYGVYPRGDKRRRPSAKLGRDQIDLALSAGRLEKRDGAFVLSEAGRFAIRRLTSEDEPFAAQHREMTTRELIDTRGEIGHVRANALESPLGKYRDSLPARAIEAGERFCRDYASSTLNPAVIRNWSDPSGARKTGHSPGSEDVSISRIVAKDRVLTALDAVGPSLEPVLTAALIREDSLAAIERRFGWSARSGRTVLQLALEALARHYGL